MSQTPNDDGEFADLFRKLPDAPGSAPNTAPASRREARAAQQSVPTAVADEPDLAELFNAPVDKGKHARDRRKSRVAAWVFFAVIVLVLGGLTAGGFAVWNTYEDRIRAFMGWEEPRDFEPGLAEGEAMITIADGDIPADISHTLFEAGVTKTPGAFYDHLISTGQNPTFYAGVYRMQQKMTSAAALAALEDPENKLENTVLLREGLTLEQSLPLLADGTGIPLADLEAAVQDPAAYGVTADTLEGWIFPLTYDFGPDATASDVIGTVVGKTKEALDREGVAEADRQRVLTIASIIQREARLDEDFFKVSRVIANRLADGMRLQMDSTAQFGFREMHSGSASTSAEALADDNAWNTYVVDGLPAGPISNPGDLAIQAAVHPADGNWLYFVTWNMDTGETDFSATLAEHEAGTAKWKQWCADNDNRGC